MSLIQQIQSTCSSAIHLTYDVQNEVLLLYPSSMSLSDEQQSIVRTLKQKLPHIEEMCFSNISDLSTILECKTKDLYAKMRQYQLSRNATLCAIILYNGGQLGPFDNITIPFGCNLYCLNLSNQNIQSSRIDIPCYRIAPDAWQTETLFWLVLRFATMPMPKHDSNQSVPNNCDVQAELLKANEQLLAVQIAKSLDRCLKQGDNTVFEEKIIPWVEQKVCSLTLPVFSEQPILWDGWEWLCTNRGKTIEISLFDLSKRLYAYQDVENRLPFRFANVDAICSDYWNELKWNIKSAELDYIDTLKTEIRNYINDNIEQEITQTRDEIRARLNRNVRIFLSFDSIRRSLSELDKLYSQYLRLRAKQEYYTAIKNRIDSDTSFIRNRNEGIHRLNCWHTSLTNFSELDVQSFSFSTPSASTRVDWTIKDESALVKVFSQPDSKWTEDLFKNVVLNYKVNFSSDIGPSRIDILCSQAIKDAMKDIDVQPHASAITPNLISTDLTNNELVFISFSKQANVICDERTKILKKDLIEQLKRDFSWGSISYRESRFDNWNISCSYLWRGTEGVRSIIIKLMWCELVNGEYVGREIISSMQRYPANTSRLFNMNCGSGLYLFHIFAELDSNEMIDTGIVSQHFKCGDFRLDYQFSSPERDLTMITLIQNITDSQMTRHYAYHLWIEYHGVKYLFPVIDGKLVQKCCVPVSARNVTLWTDVDGYLERI